ncbi:MAG: 1,4-alpha-glucan branching protein GlgB [Eubacteriales bacterium]
MGQMKSSKESEVNVRLTEMDLYLFGQGTHYEIYNKLGAHPSVENDESGVYFALWAPNAVQVHVVGEFNEWDEWANPMNCMGEIGVYEVFIPKAEENMLYKFLITTQDGRRVYKSDPYANYAEVRPNTASKVTNLKNFTWSDKKWLESRKNKNMFQEPMSVYECHIGSWKKHPDETEDGFYTYREFADHMVAYVKEMNYTHVELMGIAEHPFDGSWGYQVTGYYAPTSRYGSPEDFMYLVDQLHKNDVGVILDWVPAHFPKDAHGLAEFDGFCLYEHEDPRIGEHEEWGTKIFNLGRNEVRNFLIANALFWIQEYHIDGLRVDAVASMLYLNYGKEDGKWIANEYGGNENLEAIEFFKHLNSVIRSLDNGAITIAEESTAWPNVTKSPEEGGLGFHFKWNMGWMHDFCEYMQLDPYFRKDHHYKMTFAMTYNEYENYIMPLSHDEVVHLKCSMVNKMPGYPWDKFANLRVGYAYMFAHEGKKLLFMGQDFAQQSEWNEKTELEWGCLQEPLHQGMHQYVSALLKLYKKYPCLYEIDNSWEGFEWMNADDLENSIYTFVRKGRTNNQRLLFVLNMTPVHREHYRVAVLEDTTYKLVLNSDDVIFGGRGKNLPLNAKAEEVWNAGKQFSIPCNLPPYAALVYEF